MIQNAEQVNKIAELRAKSAAGTLTLEEMREAITIMRQGRRTAAETKKVSKAKTPAKSADALLAELGGL